MTQIVNTTAGKIEGLAQEGLLVFKGVPFAAPPVGPLRWQPPQPLTPWSGVRPAKTFGYIPPQPEIPAPLSAVLPGFVIPGEQNEDCLYLNIWTPAADNAKRPVMVWITGGGFIAGAGSQPLFNGATLAKRGNLVLVTINYRLGMLGFLNLHAVTQGKIPATGNEGLLDQVAALKWVKENISAFGGDPDNVTIFGESAGSMAISTLLALPAAQGYFHKAILQSGGNAIQTLELATRKAERFLEALQLKPTDVEALYALSAAELITAGDSIAPVIPRPNGEFGVVPMNPVVDGATLPAMPIEAVANGSAGKVTVLAGSNLNEWKFVTGMDPNFHHAMEDEALLEKEVRRLVEPGDAQALIAAYKTARGQRGESTANGYVFEAIKADQGYRIPAIRLLDGLKKQGNRVYNYLFTWPSPLFGGVLGACHYLDIGFIFGTNKMSQPQIDFSGSGAEVEALEQKMQDAWIAFAHTGNPSCDSLGQWPEYGEERNTMLLGQQCGVEQALYDEERQAWESMPNIAIGTFR